MSNFEIRIENADAFADFQRRNGDTQVRSIKAMQCYEPPARGSKTGKRPSPMAGAAIVIGGAVLGFVLFAAICATTWILDSQSCTGLYTGRTGAPISRGFEGG